MPTTGQWIREELLAAGDRGVVIADLHKKRKALHGELGLTYKKGTYSSFAKLFNFLWQLKWVERTGETEASHSKGDEHELQSVRTYYRITNEGLACDEKDWYDPIATLHPEWTGSKRRIKYYLPTGKPRGAPRIGPPKIKKLVKPPEVKKPRVKKIPEIVITEKEKAELLEELREVIRGRFKREPTRTEIYEMLLEETKLRRRKAREEKE